MAFGLCEQSQKFNQVSAYDFRRILWFFLVYSGILGEKELKKSRK